MVSNLVVEIAIYNFYLFHSAIMHLLQHCWTSAQGMCVAYNEHWRNSKNTKFVKRFLEVNHTVGGHFHRKQISEELFDGEYLDNQEKHGEEEDDDEKEEEKNEKEEEEEDLVANRKESNMHLAHRKNMSTAFYSRQIVLEMEERGETEEIIFGPKDDPSDISKKISYKKSCEHYMVHVESLRIKELYTHLPEECSTDCKKRGCDRVATVDGNWKVCHKGRGKKKIDFFRK